MKEGAGLENMRNLETVCDTDFEETLSIRYLGRLNAFVLSCSIIISLNKLIVFVFWVS